MSAKMSCFLLWCMTSDPTLKFILFKEGQLHVMEPGDIKAKKPQTYGGLFGREVASIVRKKCS